MHLRYKHIITIISILLLESIAQAAGLKVKGRFEVKEGELSGSIVTIERNGQNVKSFQPSKGKNDLGLEFGYNYTISFSKPGYVSKSIVFITSVPNDVIDKGSFQYEFTLEIFKQVDGVNTMVYNQPVAKIYYSRESDNFVDDKNYTATIQAQMAKVDAEIEKKKAEPIAVVNKPVEISKNNTSTNTIVTTTASATQTTIQTNTSTENLKKKEETQNNTPVKKNDIKKDEADKAKIEAQQRKMLQEKEENRRRTQKLAEEEATRENQQAQINLEKQKKAFRAEREAEGKKEREEQMLADEKRKEDFAKAKEEKLKQEKLSQEEEKKRKAAMDKGPFVKKEEHIDDDQKKITIITYSRKNETIVYRKIVYKWGAIYYFKNELPITDLIYKDETSKK